MENKIFEIGFVNKKKEKLYDVLVIGLLVFFICFVSAVLLWFPAFLVYVISDSVAILVCVIVAIIILVGTVCFCIVKSVLKKPLQVMLTDNEIIISTRQLISVNGCELHLRYEKISDCKHTDFVPYWDKQGQKQVPYTDVWYLYITCDEDSFVEIETFTNHYFVSVQNSDDFINEVNKRVELAKSKKNDETSQSAVPTNMFQFDLQRGYMPNCDEIVLGVNGVEFKTDKATADLINVKSISYNDIQLCKKSDKHSINGVDSDNIVEITTATQTYYIPIKNPYGFINELYKKLNTCNQ